MDGGRALTIEQQRKILERGVEEILPAGELEPLLRIAQSENRPLRVKLGIDPTASDIHLGFAVVLRKLRQFQDLGHTACLVIGDFTASIGDPSGRSKTRPVLSRAEIERNVHSYEQQLYRILDPDRTEISYNGDWLAEMRFADVIQLASQYTAARMLERDDFAKRIEDQQPVYIHETLYPLCQGQDSVQIRADIELGGSDQKFNNLVGRDLQRNAGQRPQLVMLMPLLVGTDGVEKMSKSLDNYIGIDEPPEEQFGKAMSIPDEQIAAYLELATDAPPEEIEAARGAQNPMAAKTALAKRVAALYHGREAAERAAEHFASTVRRREAPDEMPELNAAPLIEDNGKNKGVWIVKLIAAAGFAESNSAARRLIQQGAVSIDGERITDANAHVSPADGAVLKAGKRRFARLVMK
ncbi:MAG: tyrosine--tRNA ligase [Candidatus Poribacteria bacterium]|nr:tyrosine--tRNA ligase [Candidatus Poribacteria bacterium]